MSVPKSFEQVLEGWREIAANKLGHALLVMCADEAQPILDKLREIWGAMPCDNYGSEIAGHDEVTCPRCQLGRTLGERES